MSLHEAPQSAGPAPVTAGDEAQMQDDGPPEPEDAEVSGSCFPPEANGAPDRQPEGEAAGMQPVDDQGPLPALDELVARIPVDTRQLVDELFRAKFVKVQRVDRKHLKA